MLSIDALQTESAFVHPREPKLGPRRAEVVTSPEVIPQRQQGVMPSCLELARGVQDTSHTRGLGSGSSMDPLYTKEKGYDIIAMSPIATWEPVLVWSACFVQGDRGGRHEPTDVDRRSAYTSVG